MITHSGEQDSHPFVVRSRPGDSMTTPPAADPARLDAVLQEVSGMVLDGHYDTDEREGVLLDVTVGQVRCLLVHQEPALRVTLSPRERQIALMVAHGRTNQAIATSLEISVWTVSTHLRRIFAKLGVSSRAEMVARLLADHDYSALVIPD